MSGLRWIALCASLACARAYRANPRPEQARLAPTPRAPRSGERERLQVLRDEVAIRQQLPLGPLIIELQRVLDDHDLPCRISPTGLHSFVIRCVDRAPRQNLFHLGLYDFRGPSDRQECRPPDDLPLAQSRAQAWVAIGTKVREHLLREGPSEVAITMFGSVDRARCCLCFDGCPELRRYFRYDAAARWGRSHHDDLDVHRTHREEANRQLSWCRAAAVGARLLGGVRGLTSTGEVNVRVGSHASALDPVAGVAGAVSIEYSVAGVGTFLVDTHAVSCPSVPAAPVAEACEEARRVEIQFDLAPRRLAAEECDADRGFPAGALYCYQDAWRRRAGLVTLATAPSGMPTPPAVPTVPGLDRALELAVSTAPHDVWTARMHELLAQARGGP